MYFTKKVLIKMIYLTSRKNHRAVKMSIIFVGGVNRNRNF